MSDVGELLELLHGASRRWQTVRMVSRRWHDGDLTRTAMEREADRRRAGAGGGGAAVSTRGGGPPTSETVTRTWVDRPGDRSRVEMGNEHGPILTVRAGTTCWTYTPFGGVQSHQSAAHEEEHGVLLDPSPVIGAFDFTVTGTAAIAVRAALTVLARPRADGPMGSLRGQIAIGADEVRLAVDRVRGVLLRTEARLDGRPFAVEEVTEIAFDEAFDDEVFRFVAPDGGAVLAPIPVVRPERVSLAEAARRASFTVLNPARLPDGWDVEVAHVAASDHPHQVEAVTMAIRDRASHEVRLRIRQTTEPDEGPSLTLEVEGTHVRLSGAIDRDTLVAIASHLEPVREC